MRAYGYGLAALGQHPVYVSLLSLFWGVHVRGNKLHVTKSSYGGRPPIGADGVVFSVRWCRTNSLMCCRQEGTGSDSRTRGVR